MVQYYPTDHFSHFLRKKLKQKWQQTFLRFKKRPEVTQIRNNIIDIYENGNPSVLHIPVDYALYKLQTCTKSYLHVSSYSKLTDKNCNSIRLLTGAIIAHAQLSSTSYFPSPFLSTDSILPVGCVNKPPHCRSISDKRKLSRYATCQ